MKKIQILPKNVASKIAAGEVIERPASVVKELIENSLDAKANTIELNLEKAGKRSIQIIDNGEGIYKEDLPDAVKRHATSKIKTEEDLNSIKSLGFRGEALYSIAAVSKLIIRSKPKDQKTGYEAVFIAGELRSEKPVGMQDGTEIIVENLFFNLPARKKFLKSDITEYKHILQTFINYAAAFPDISFTLRHNKKTIFNLKPSILEKRLNEVFNLHIEDNFLKIEKDLPFKLTLFLAKPDIVEKIQKLNLIFVNKRPVRSPTIFSAIKTAMHTYIPEKLSPSFFVFLEIDPSLYDVNIHPRKEEIKFVNQEIVFRFIENSVRETLRQAKGLSFRATATIQIKNSLSQPTAPQQTPKTKTDFKQPQYPLPKPSFGKSFEPKLSSLYSQEILKKTQKEKYIQMLNLFIIWEKEDKIVIIDQHAAHERILYEKFSSQVKKAGKVQTKQLLIPIIIQLNPVQMEALRENKELFEKLGIILEEFGPNTIRIREIPSVSKQSDIEKIIHNILNELIEEKKPKYEQRTERAIATLACRSAVKSGDKLDEVEIEKIIEELDLTDNSYTCPHGRPTHIILTKKELEKLFKRR